MKPFALLVFCLFSLNLLSNDLKESMPTYVVLSDEADDKIEAGYYIVEGKIVFEEDQNKLVENVKIQIQNGKEAFSKTGYFELKMPVSSYYASFSNSKIDETYYENHNVKEKRRIKVIVYASKPNARHKVVAEKPVLYGYCDTLIQLSINLQNKGDLLFTYPPLPENKTWKMFLYKNEFADRSGKMYPYLFWDASMLLAQPDFSIGFVVQKDSVVAFLENQLSVLGLNAREKTDFITYWGPRLRKEEFVFMRFCLQDQCAPFADYAISPRPEHFNRLYLLFSNLSNEEQAAKVKAQLQPQELQSFERGGFELLEWGGIEMPLNEALTDL